MRETLMVSAHEGVISSPDRLQDGQFKIPLSSGLRVWPRSKFKCHFDGSSEQQSASTDEKWCLQDLAIDGSEMHVRSTIIGCRDRKQHTDW